MREMKHSHVPWIGDIPVDWEVRKVKFLAKRISKGNGITKDEVSPDGDMPCVRYGEIYTKYNNSFTECVSATRIEIHSSPQYVYKGDILLAGTGELVEEIGKGIVYLGEEKCIAGGDIILLTPICNSLFLNYALNSSYAQAQKSHNKAKLKVVHISPSEIGSIQIAVPSECEQLRIAHLLDAKCAEIDSILEQAQASIEEYKKLKQSFITEAVTKGIRGERPMKDSGVEWIGAIPADWDVMKIKWLLKERNDRSEEGYEEPLSMSQKFGIIPTKDMDMVPNMASSFVGAKLVYRGDLVFNKLKAHLGVFAVSEYEGLVSPDYAVYYSAGRCDVKYLERIFKTPQYISEFRKRSTGVGAGLTRLYTSDLFDMYTALPSETEQKEISAYLDDKCATIASLIASKEALITELEAYKKSLIYEYVSGKKEVI